MILHETNLREYKEKRRMVSGLCSEEQAAVEAGRRGQVAHPKNHCTAEHFISTEMW